MTSRYKIHYESGGLAGGIVEQRFARSEHGFALVDVTPENLIVAYYSIQAWEFAVAKPLRLVAEEDAVFRCTWRYGANEECKESSAF